METRKKDLKKWALRLTATLLLCFGFLVGIVLNPSVLYANKTITGNYTVYHDAELNENFISLLKASIELVKSSELYDSAFHLDICLNEDSNYPALIEKLGGQAFARGFYNKVVLMGHADCANNFVALNGYKWNLVQLLAHEQVHCFQFHKFGFWKSNPVANVPQWKWEGYAEYVARKNPEQIELTRNIERGIAAVKDDWAIFFSDSTIAPRDYYHAWLLVQYCMDIKNMSYENLLADTTNENEVTIQMMRWFSERKNLHYQ